MRNHRKLSALAAILIAGIMAVVTSGVAQAAWVWCDDPILTVGNDSAGYSRIYVQYAVDIPGKVPASNFSSGLSPSLKLRVPQGINVTNIVEQGWSVAWQNDTGLSATNGGFHANFDVIVNTVSSQPDNPLKVRVRISLDPQGRHVLGQAVADVGQEFTMKAFVPVSAKWVDQAGK